MQKVHLQYDHGKSLFYIGKHKKNYRHKIHFRWINRVLTQKHRIHISMPI